jgi:hypothetical protein
MDTEECTNPHPLAMQSSVFRVKCQAVVGAFLVLGLVAAASSIYSDMQLAVLSAAQDVNLQILQEHETRLLVNERSIALINSTVLRMGKKVAKLSDSLGTDEMILQLGFTLDSVFEDLTRILRGLNALADHWLSPDFVKTSKMTEALLLLENSMQREGYELGLETMDDIFRCEISHLVWDNGTLNIYLHIPAYKIDSRLQFLEHVPVPLILPEMVKQYPMSKGYRNTAMFVQPLLTILAIQAGGSAFTVFTREELGACQVLGGTYFCPNSNILDKRVETNCVLGLYNRNEEVITANCPWISSAATNFTVQLGANKFLLYHSNSKEVQLVCGKESATQSFQGLKQLHVPAGCQLFTESYIMEGQQNFSLLVDTFIERHMNVAELFNFSRFHVNDMAGIIKDLDLVASTTGLTIKNIKDRYNDYSIESPFVWATWWVVICISILGLGGIFLCLLRRYKKAKKDHLPLLRRFKNLFSTDDLGPRDQEMQRRGGLEEDSDYE